MKKATPNELLGQIKSIIDMNIVRPFGNKPAASLTNEDLQMFENQSLHMKELVLEFLLGATINYSENGNYNIKNNRLMPSEKQVRELNDIMYDELEVARTMKLKEVNDAFKEHQSKGGNKDDFDFVGSSNNSFNLNFANDKDFAAKIVSPEFLKNVMFTPPEVNKIYTIAMKIRKKRNLIITLGVVGAVAGICATGYFVWKGIEKKKNAIEVIEDGEGVIDYTPAFDEFYAVAIPSPVPEVETPVIDVHGTNVTIDTPKVDAKNIDVHGNKITEPKTAPKLSNTSAPDVKSASFIGGLFTGEKITSFNQMYHR